jgi:hypothetical protein
MVAAATVVALRGMAPGVSRLLPAVVGPGSVGVVAFLAALIALLRGREPA